MTQSLENKRAGRETELKNKMKGTIERYESVFGKPLDVKTILDYLTHEELNNKMVFMRDRMGVLSDADVGFLRNMVKVTKAAPELVPNLGGDEDFDLDENLDEVDENEAN